MAGTTAVQMLVVGLLDGLGGTVHLNTFARDVNQGEGAKRSVAAVIWIGSGLGRRYVVRASGAIVTPGRSNSKRSTGAVEYALRG